MAASGAFVFVKGERFPPIYGTKEPARETEMPNFRSLPSCVFRMWVSGEVFCLFVCFPHKQQKPLNWYVEKRTLVSFKLDLWMALLYVVISEVEAVPNGWVFTSSSLLLTLDFFEIGHNDWKFCFFRFNEVILKPQVVNDSSCISVQFAFSCPVVILKYFCFSVWWMEGEKNWDM